MKIVTFGGASQDIFIHHEDIQTIDICRNNEKESFLLLQEGSKIEIDALRYSVGGGATNSAVSFKRLGFEVSTFFKIGDDSQGAQIIKTLQHEGIALDYCIIDKNGQTGISFIIPSFHGERTVLAFRGSNTQIKEYEMPLEALKQFSTLYITSLSGESSQLLAPLAQRAKSEGLLVANNPGRSQLLAGAAVLCKALSSIDILILNRDEARQLMLSLLYKNKIMPQQSEHDTSIYAADHLPTLLKNTFIVHEETFSLIDYCNEVMKRGPKIVVVTNGAEGVYVCTENRLYFHPSFPVKVVNTLGAGDAFGSAFVAGLIRYNSIDQAIRYGILNSISVISHTDAKTGLMNQCQLDKELDSLDKRLLQTFDL